MVDCLWVCKTRVIKNVSPFIKVLIQVNEVLHISRLVESSHNQYFEGIESERMGKQHLIGEYKVSKSAGQEYASKHCQQHEDIVHAVVPGEILPGLNKVRDKVPVALF